MAKIIKFYLLTLCAFFSVSVIFINIAFCDDLGNIGGFITQMSLVNNIFEDTNVINKGSKCDLWIKPYRMQDNLDNSTNILDNTITGALAGIDLFINKYSLLKFYVGMSYIESTESNYKMNILKQNSYIFGVTYMMITDKYYYGINANISSNNINTDSFYGVESFGTNMYSVGITGGYNIYLKENFILEPNCVIMYGKISGNENVVNSNHDNNILIKPQIKAKLNLANMWQPYAIIGGVLNSQGTSNLTINYIDEEIKVSQYFEYGLGVNKDFGNVWGCYLQIICKGGDRVGLDGNLGVRYRFLNEENKLKIKTIKENNKQQKQFEKEQKKLEEEKIKQQREEQNKLKIEQEKIEKERLEQEEQKKLEEIINQRYH